MLEQLTPFLLGLVTGVLTPMWMFAQRLTRVETHQIAIREALKLLREQYADEVKVHIREEHENLRSR